MNEKIIWDEGWRIDTDSQQASGDNGDDFPRSTAYLEQITSDNGLPAGQGAARDSAAEQEPKRDISWG